jgi:chromosome segregation ATPase
MMVSKLNETKALFSLTSKRLETAEIALGAALRRLSALDAEIAALCIERAQTADAPSLAAIELLRRMAALRIDEKRKERRALVDESETLRDETRRLLRQKIALEAELAASDEEIRRRRRNRV